MIIVYLILVVILIFQRLSVLTFAAWFSLVWGTPMIFEGIPSPAGIIYASFSVLCILLHRLIPEPLGVNQVRLSLFNTVFFSFVLLTGLVIIMDGGLSGFLSGKYGPVPSGNMVVYYTWNSVLLLTCVLACYSKEITHYKLAVLFVSLALLLVSGDRTIIGLVLVSYIYSISRGKRPIEYSRNIKHFAFTLIFCFILYIGKDFYAYYALGYDFETIIEEINPSLIFYRLEFWHNYNMVNNIYYSDFSYDLIDYLSEFSSLIPFLQLGADPHKFSFLIKDSFYSDWSVATGVGGNYFGQGYAVGGILGVLFSASLLVCFLLLVARLIGHRNQLFSIMGLVVMPVLVFYVHRNSLAQLLSFIGRYEAITLIFYFMFSFLRQVSSQSSAKINLRSNF